jgi:hypothetical protein
VTMPAVFSWATSPPGGYVVAPSGGLIASGYAPDAVPSSANWNYITQQLGLWTAWNSTLDGTQVPLNYGGGLSITATIAALPANPLTTLGDTMYGGASGVQTRLPGNITLIPQVNVQTGNGTISAAPVKTNFLGSSMAVSTANAQTLDQAIPSTTGAIVRDSRGCLLTVNGVTITRSNGLITGVDSATVTYARGQVSGS